MWVIICESPENNEGLTPLKPSWTRCNERFAGDIRKALGILWCPGAIATNGICYDTTDLWVPINKEFRVTKMPGNNKHCVLSSQPVLGNTEPGTILSKIVKERKLIVYNLHIPMK